MSQESPRRDMDLAVGDVGGPRGGYVVAFNDGRICPKHGVAHPFVTANCVPIAWPSDCAPLHLSWHVVDDKSCSFAWPTASVERIALLRRVQIAQHDRYHFVPPRVFRHFPVEAVASDEPDAPAP